MNDSRNNMVELPLTTVDLMVEYIYELIDKREEVLLLREANTLLLKQIEEDNVRQLGLDSMK